MALACIVVLGVGYAINNNSTDIVLIACDQAECNHNLFEEHTGNIAEKLA